MIIMCRYCDKNPRNSLIFNFINNDGLVIDTKLSIKSGRLQISMNCQKLHDIDELDRNLLYGKDAIKIKYCPFCGRKLEQPEKHILIVNKTKDSINNYLNTLSKDDFDEFESLRSQRNDSSSDGYYADLKWFNELYKEINKTTEHYIHIGVHKDLKEYNKWAYKDFTNRFKDFKTNNILILICEFEHYYGDYTQDEINEYLKQFKLDKIKCLSVNFGSDINEIIDFINK